MAKTVVLTGGAGLLGRSVAERCVERGWTVVAVGRGGAPAVGVEAVSVDLASDWSDRLLPERIDVVVHLAQSSRFRDFPEHARDLFGVNVASTAKLLDYARSAGAVQFVYASTGGLYEPRATALDEGATVLAPDRLGAYFGSKRCGEILTWTYGALFTTTILRPFFVYGPGQKRSMHLPRLYDRVRAGEPIQLQGDAGIRINPLHVSEAAQAVLSGIEGGVGGVVNLAGPDVVSIREIAEAFGRHCGRPPIFEQTGQPGLDLVADISLMRARLHDPTRRLFDSLDDIAV